MNKKKENLRKKKKNSRKNSFLIINLGLFWLGQRLILWFRCIVLISTSGSPCSKHKEILKQSTFYKS